MRKFTPRPGTHKLKAVDALCFSLMILRTGADLCFLGPKFGIEQRYCGFVFRRVVSRIKGLSVLYLRFPSQEEARSRCISKFREVSELVYDCINVTFIDMRLIPTMLQ